MQNKMAHFERREALSKPVREDVRKAAVLLLLFSRDARWHTVLIRRKAIDGDVHSGQISFPGGRMQHHETPEQAAIRETFEEIGCAPENITTLGRLTELHIPVSNHLVFPVVGYLDSYSGWMPQESEVAQIFEVPLTQFLVSDATTRTEIRLGDGLILRDVPSYEAQGQIIWGATAMILSEFSVLMEQIQP